MKILIVMIFFFLVGCNVNSWQTEFKCYRGDVYIKHNGAWIEAKLYDENKCLSDGNK